MNTGTVVQFREPLNAEERKERFLVLEDRTKRLLVQDLAFAHWPIAPTAVYRASDLMRTTDEDPTLFGLCSACGCTYYIGSWNDLNKECPNCGKRPINEEEGTK